MLKRCNHGAPVLRPSPPCPICPVLSRISPCYTLWMSESTLGTLPQALHAQRAASPARTRTASWEPQSRISSSQRLCGGSPCRTTPVHPGPSPNQGCSAGCLARPGPCAPPPAQPRPPAPPPPAVLQSAGPASRSRNRPAGQRMGSPRGRGRTVSNPRRLSAARQSAPPDSPAALPTP